MVLDSRRINFLIFYITFREKWKILIEQLGWDRIGFIYAGMLTHIQHTYAHTNTAECWAFIMLH